MVEVCFGSIYHERMEFISGFFGVAIVLAILATVAVWVVFPFLVMSRLAAQQKALDEIARNTKRKTSD